MFRKKWKYIGRGVSPQYWYKTNIFPFFFFWRLPLIFLVQTSFWITIFLENFFGDTFFWTHIFWEIIFGSKILQLLFLEKCFLDKDCFEPNFFLTRTTITTSITLMGFDTIEINLVFFLNGNMRLFSGLLAINWQAS